jgi:hypothetical protein
MYRAAKPAPNRPGCRPLRGSFEKFVNAGFSHGFAMGYMTAPVG